MSPAASPSGSSSRTLSRCSGENCWCPSRCASDWADCTKPRLRSVYFSKFMFFVPSAYPGSPEGTTGTSSLGEFWRKDLANAGPRNRRKNRHKPQPTPDNDLYGGGFRAGKGLGRRDFSPSPARGRVAPQRGEGWGVRKGMIQLA